MDMMACVTLLNSDIKSSRSIKLRVTANGGYKFDSVTEIEYVTLDLTVDVSPSGVALTGNTNGKGGTGRTFVNANVTLV